MAAGTNTSSTREFRTRLIPGPDSSTLDLIITRNAKPDKHTSTITYNSKIRPEDTYLAEAYSPSLRCVRLLRFIQIPILPPTNQICIESYKQITHLAIQCPVDFKWLFNEVLPYFNQLQELALTREAFVIVHDQQQQQQRADQDLTVVCEECPSVTQLHLRAIPTPKVDNNELIQIVNLFLEYCSKSFKNLQSADVKLPMGTCFKQFVCNYESLKDSGDIVGRLKEELDIFKSSTNTGTKKRMATTPSSASKPIMAMAPNNNMPRNKPAPEEPWLGSTSPTTTTHLPYNTAAYITSPASSTLSGPQFISSPLNSPTMIPVSSFDAEQMHLSTIRGQLDWSTPAFRRRSSMASDYTHSSVEDYEDSSLVIDEQTSPLSPPPPPPPPPCMFSSDPTYHPPAPVRIPFTLTQQPTTRSVPAPEARPRQKRKVVSTNIDYDNFHKYYDRPSKRSRNEQQ